MEVALADEVKALGAVMAVGDDGVCLDLVAVGFHVCFLLLRRMVKEEAVGVFDEAVGSHEQIALGGGAQG